MEIKSLQEILALVKSAVIVLGMAAVIVIAWFERDMIIETLSDLANRTQGVEIAGVKIAFGDKAFVLNPSIEHFSIAEQQKIKKDVYSLGPDEADRLLHITEYDEEHVSDDDLNCDYPNADRHMRLVAAADEGLVEKMLAKIIRKNEFTARIRDKNKKLERKNGKPLSIGEANNCYQIILTDAGRNAKSVIVSEVTRAFGAVSEALAEPKSVERPREKKK